MSEIKDPHEYMLTDVFTIGEHTFENKLNEDLYINQTALNDAFVEHSERFAWYATAYEMALAYENNLKEQLARVYAQEDYKARTEAKSAKIRMTEKMVENTVITSPNYMLLQENYLTAKHQTGLLRAAKDAMIHRRDMLIQLGANYRAEGASDIIIKEQEYKKNFGNK